MPFALNNTPTSDGYVAGTTLACAGAVRLNLSVANAAIFYSFQPPGGAYGQEVFLAPGYYSLARRADAIKVRSAAAGRPAQVTIEALTAAELNPI